MRKYDVRCIYMLYVWYIVDTISVLLLEKKNINKTYTSHSSVHLSRQNIWHVWLNQPIVNLVIPLPMYIKHTLKKY